MVLRKLVNNAGSDLVTQTNFFITLQSTIVKVILQLGDTSTCIGSVQDI